MRARHYTLVVTPTPGFVGDITVDVAAAAAVDASTGNNSTVAIQSVQAVDQVAPTATATAATISNSGNASVQSDEIGNAYLVKDGINPTTVANITAAADGQWNSVAISTVATNTNLSAAGLDDGVYHVYAADAAGNLSPTSGAAVTLDSTKPIASVTAATISNSGNASVQSDGIGTAYLVKDGINPTTVANITAAADGQWNSVAISAAATNTSLSAAGLVDGVYHVYAADAAGNLSLTSSAAVTLDSTVPTVTNMAVLDGVSNLSVTSDIVLTFGVPITATTDGLIQIVNDANDTAKNGYETETTAHTINLYLGTSSTANGVTTWTAFQEAGKTTASGSVSIDDVTGVVTINPLYDLDLSNNYHVEISANTFHKVSNGLGNEAFGAAGTEMNFSTVTPGDVVASTGDLGAAVLSSKMTSDGGITGGQYWVSLDVAGLGTTETALKHLDLSAEDYAVVMKDNSSATIEFGVLTSNFFGLGSYAAGDALYFDRQINDKIFSAVDVGDTLSGGIQTAGYTDATHPNPGLMYFSYDVGGGWIGAFAFTDAAADAEVWALTIPVIIA